MRIPLKAYFDRLAEQGTPRVDPREVIDARLVVGPAGDDGLVPWKPQIVRDRMDLSTVEAIAAQALPEGVLAWFGSYAFYRCTGRLGASHLSLRAPAPGREPWAFIAACGAWQEERGYLPWLPMGDELGTFRRVVVETRSGRVALLDPDTGRIDPLAEDLGELVRRLDPTPVAPRSPPHLEELVLVGAFRELPHGDPDGPSLRDAVRPDPNPEDALIAEYLANGEPHVMSPGVVEDVLEPGEPIGTGSVLTDGVFAWSDDVAHYVRRWHARLDPEFVDHVRLVARLRGP